VDVITCAIFRECRLRGVGVARGVSLPSPIDLTRRPYNTGHTTCDRVINAKSLNTKYFRKLKRLLCLKSGPMLHFQTRESVLRGTGSISAPDTGILWCVGLLK